MMDFCPGCAKNSMIECLECGMGISQDCICYLDQPHLDMATLYCHECGDHIQVEIGDFIEDYDPSYFLSYVSEAAEERRAKAAEEEEFDEDVLLTDSHKSIKPVNPYLSARDDDWDWFDFGYKCRHKQEVVKLPSGVTLYASSGSSVYKHEERVKPDFGLYLDNMWKSPGFAYYIEWRDYGLPAEQDMDDALLVIADVYKKARSGLFVEVGCIGGHGRTGTALAIMAILEGLNTQEAVEYVRDVYCQHAIEGKNQRWYVDYANCFFNGGTTEICPGANPTQAWIFENPFDWEEWDINNIGTE